MALVTGVRSPVGWAGCEPGGAASQPGVPATPAITPLPISVTDAKYGLLSVRTVPGARCQADLRITAGTYGDAPPTALPGTSAGPDGFVTWTYAAPRVPSGTAGYTVRCQGDAASEVKTGNFTIPTRPIVASSLTVRVTTDLPPQEQVNVDPALVARRDESFATIKATLADGVEVGDAWNGHAAGRRELGRHHDVCHRGARHIGASNLTWR